MNPYNRKVRYIMKQLTEDKQEKLINLLAKLVDFIKVNYQSQDDRVKIIDYIILTIKCFTS